MKHTVADQIGRTAVWETWRELLKSLLFLGCDPIIITDDI